MGLPFDMNCVPGLSGTAAQAPLNEFEFGALSSMDCPRPKLSGLVQVQFCGGTARASSASRIKALNHTKDLQHAPLMTYPQTLV